MAKEEYKSVNNLEAAADIFGEVVDKVRKGFSSYKLFFLVEDLLVNRSKSYLCPNMTQSCYTISL